MPSGLRRRLLGLCVPPLLFWLSDGTLTLVGQSAEYWHGSYRAHVNEGSPTLHDLLSIHPAAFAAGMVAWAAIFVALILLLPDTLALIVSVAVVLGHTIGTATWLLYHFRFGYQICNGLFLLAAVAIGVGVRWGWRAVPSEPLRLNRMPQWLRWTMVLALVGAAVYLFLWPKSIAP